VTWNTGGYNNWFEVTADPKFDARILKTAKHLYENFEQAGDYTINLIAQDWSHKPLYLTLSGGLDSEFVAKLLVKNKIKFTPVILKIDLLNEPETWYAEYWCYKNSITPIVLHYNVSQFTDAMKRHYKWLVELKNFALIPQAIVYDYVNQQQGHLIYCAGDMQIDVNTVDQFYLHSFDLISNIASVGSHPTSFYMYAPELLLSYVYCYDINLPENYNKINAYQVSPRPKVPYQQHLDQHPWHQEYKQKMMRIAKLDLNNYHKPCYFGTREQILQKLSP